MSQVVLLTHEGVRCALPASQVVRAAAPEGEPEIRLWPGSADGGGHHGARALLVETPSGRRLLRCRDVAFASLDEAPMRPLPELLSGCLGLSHVVGVSPSEGSLLWLVDLQCWEDL